MRVFIASLATETNTFAPFPSGHQAYAEYGITKTASTDLSSPLSIGMSRARQLAESEGDEVIESISAFAQPGGRTVQSVYERLRDTILNDLAEANAKASIDLVLLMLHGAMVAAECDDCEGDILRQARSIVPDAAIGTVLDLHCHLTDAMLEAANVIITVKEYPHIDFGERTAELYALCRRTKLGEIQPAAAMVDTRMIGMYPTFAEPMKRIVAELRAMEQQAYVLSASIAHGFPWADVKDVGTRVLVYVDQRRADAALAATHAQSIARKLYGLRRDLLPRYPDIQTSISRALELQSKEACRIVLGDYSDNPGGGGAGDSTFFLQALIERQVANVAIGCMWDPVIVQLCTDAGEGSTMAVRLGGKTSALSGDPIDLTVTVMRCVANHSEGVFGSRQPLGNSVWLRHTHEKGHIDIAVSAIRAQVYEPDAFTGLGITLHDKALIVVKSSTHYEAGFQSMADHLWHVQSPGAMQLNFGALPYTKRDGNFFPRVDDPWVNGEPAVKTFGRSKVVAPTNGAR
jgi:microcystin degradation protein MlrC